MKKLFFTLLILFSTVGGSLVLAQQMDIERLLPYAVDRHDVKINGILPLSADITPAMLHQHFGVPDNIYSNEFFSYILTIHRYGENRFPFIEDYGRLTMFDFRDNQFSLQIDDITIRVGDSIDAFAQRFPEIYASTWTSRLTGEKAVNILYSEVNSVTGEVGLWDDYLVILRNDAGIITRIYEYGHY